MNTDDSGNETNDLSKIGQERPKPKKSCATKMLIGCGIGCGGLMVVLVFTCVGSFMYIKAPTDAVPGHALVSDKTILFSQMEVDLSDKGVTSLIKHIQEHQQKNDFNKTPKKMREFFKGLKQGQTEDQIAELGSYIDLRAMVIIDEREGAPLALVEGEGELTDRADVMVVISLRRMANLAGIFWGFAAAEAAKKGGESYKGHNLIPDNNGKWVLCLMENNFISASSMEGAKRMVDRLVAYEAAPDAVMGTAALQNAMKAFDANADVVAAVADDSTLESVIVALKEEQEEEKLPPEQVVEQVLGMPLTNVAYVTVDGDLVSEQQIVLNIFIKTRDQDKDAEMVQRLAYLLTTAESSEGFMRTGMVMVHKEKQEAEGVKVRIEFNRFWDFLEQQLDKEAGRGTLDTPEADGDDPPEAGKEKDGVNEFLEPVERKDDEPEDEPAENAPEQDEPAEEDDAQED
ncbi:MAG: hypothetical protein QF886_02175 [Planctomycetota bacterium]|nr:hypothetical protein [Planctomycetota bacterium]